MRLPDIRWSIRHTELTADADADAMSSGEWTGNKQLYCIDFSQSLWPQQSLLRQRSKWNTQVLMISLVAGTQPSQQY
jgi:hypothetical protein